jgi:hypothetical protein
VGKAQIAFATREEYFFTFAERHQPEFLKALTYLAL